MFTLIYLSIWLFLFLVNQHSCYKKIQFHFPLVILLFQNLMTSRKPKLKSSKLWFRFTCFHSFTKSSNSWCSFTSCSWSELRGRGNSFSVQFFPRQKPLLQSLWILSEDSVIIFRPPSVKHEQCGNSPPSS